MKHFLILFLGLISFLSPAQVVIKPETARYFLEADDKLKIHEEKDSLQDLQINNLNQQILVKDQIIELFELDEISYTTYIETLTAENTSLKKDLKKEKAQKRLAIGIAILTIILALL